jgi:hypothetical protein
MGILVELKLFESSGQMRGHFLAMVTVRVNMNEVLIRMFEGTVKTGGWSLMSSHNDRKLP